MAGQVESGKGLMLARRSFLAWGPGLLLLGMAASDFWIGRDYGPGASVRYGVLVGLGLLLCLLFSAFRFSADGGGLERIRGLGFPSLRLFIPVFRKRIEFAGASGVYIEQRELRSRRPGASRPNKRIVYAVGLSGGIPARTIDDFSSYEKARGLAEGLASGLGLPLRDSSSGRVATREPERMGETVAERLHREGGDEGLKKPERLLSRIRPGRGGIKVILPALGFTLLHKTCLAVLFFAALPGGLSKNWSFLGFCVLGALVITDNAIRRQVLYASREGLVMNSTGLVPDWQRFPADELEELILVPGPDPKEIPLKIEELPPWAEDLLQAFIAYKLSSRLVARSDRKTRQARLMVSREEAGYIHQKILAALAG